MTAEEHRKFAAVCYALGWTRGQLSRVLDGEADLQRVREVLNASASAQIMEALGMEETDFPAEWHEHLTDAEKWTLSGRQHDD